MLDGLLRWGPLPSVTQEKNFKFDDLSIVLSGIFVHIIKPPDTIWKGN